MAGHLYIEGALTISYKMKPKGKVQMGVTGTGAMLMRFGGNPSTNPDFGFLAYAEASPFLQVNDFALDLSGLKGTALIYIDVPSPSQFKFALRMTTEINLGDLFSTVIPQLPKFIKDAVKLLGPSGGVQAELDVYADSDWWGIKMGIAADMSALLGARLHCRCGRWSSVEEERRHLTKFPTRLNSLVIAQARWGVSWVDSFPPKWKGG